MDKKSTNSLRRGSSKEIYGISRFIDLGLTRVPSVSLHRVILVLLERRLRLKRVLYGN
jgi:hypothetical protein